MTALSAMKKLSYALVSPLSGHHRRAKAGVAGIDSIVHAEKHFRDMVLVERKRCERSGRMLLLLLVELPDDLPADSEGRYTKPLAEAVRQSMRDIDLCGWLEPRVMGVMYTEITAEKLDEAVEVIIKKVRQHVALSLPSEIACRVRIRFETFPGKAGIPRGDGDVNSPFYPDITDAGPSLFIKRFVDVVGSTLAIIFCLPIFALIALLVKLSSRGPVIFRQQRIGQYGKPFTFYKFRSMRCGTDDAIHRDYIRKYIRSGESSTTKGGSTPVFKITNDPRITPIGRFLRKTSLDELPQFFNVLKGDMSLVGPRPPIAYELENYDAWHMYRLLGARPGITGLWQVKGRSKIRFDGMVRLDIKYIRERSLWLDLKILMQTPLAVVRGAY